MSTINDKEIVLVIYGEPASKANTRKLVYVKGKMLFIKSKKALDYVKTFDKQCPPLKNLLTCDVRVEMKIYYKTRRPDLDESLILDCMQNKIYENDRQVKSTYGIGLTKKNLGLTSSHAFGICSLPSDF